MSIFAEMNRRITQNMERHGHFLTNPHAAEEHKIEDAVDLLLPLIRDDRREDVKRAIVALVHENMRGAINPEQDKP
jgi:hypothetical protein